MSKEASQTRPPVRVALVEDHAIFRQGLASLFANDDRIQVVCEASHGVDALQALLDESPDVAVLDLKLPGRSGMELFKAWRQSAPGAEAVILTSSRDPAQAVAAAEAGVLGYVLKDEVFEDLSKAVIEASQGRQFFSPGVSSLLVGHHADATRSLTPREQEVLRAVAQGDTNRRIASQLGVSVKTIESHRSNLMHKLRVRSAAELVRVAIEKGLLPSDSE